MSSAAEDVDPAAAGDQDEGGELDPRSVELLQDQVKTLEGAIEYERTPRSSRTLRVLATPGWAIWRPSKPRSPRVTVNMRC
jgi:hypothetical protein